MPASPEIVQAGRRCLPGANRGVSALMTAASWLLQRLPGQVLNEQRAELIRTLAASRTLVVKVECSRQRRW